MVHYSTGRRTKNGAIEKKQGLTNTVENAAFKVQRFSTVPGPLFASAKGTEIF